MRGLLSVSSLVLFFTLGCGVGSDPADPGTKPAEEPGAIEPDAVPDSTPAPTDLTTLMPNFGTVGDAGTAPRKLTVRFDRDIVLPEQVGSLDSDTSLVLQPPVAGAWTWTAPDRLEFEPDVGLAPGQTYNLALNALGSRWGKLGGAPVMHVLEVPAFEVLSANIAVRNLAYTDIDVVFSGPVDPSDASRVELKLAGKLVKREALDSGRDNRLRFRVKTDDIGKGEHKVAVNVPDGVRSAVVSSSKAGRKSVTVTIDTSVKALEIRRAKLVEGTDGYYVDIICHDSSVGTAEYWWDRESYESYRVSERCVLSKDSLASLTFDPPVDNLYIAEGTRGFRLFGDFVRGPLEMTLNAGSFTADGGVLQKAFKSSFEVAKRTPRVELVAKQGRYVPKGSWTNLPIRHLNADQVEVTVRRVPPENLVYWLSNEDEDATERTSDLVEKKRVAVKNPEDAMQSSWLDLGALVGEDTQGLFQIEVRPVVNGETQANVTEAAVDTGWRPPTRNTSTMGKGDTSRIVLTDLHLVAKSDETPKGGTWPKRITAFAFGAVDNRPASGTQIDAVRPSGFVMGSCRTGSDGSCVIELPPATVDAIDPTPPVALIARRGDDTTYLKFADLKASISEAEVGGASWTGTAYDASLYTDRGVYRPGDTVRFGMVLRGADHHAPAAAVPMTLSILDPRRKLAKKTTLMGDAAGMQVWDLPLASFATTGSWKAVLEVGEDKVAEYSFAVEEFVPERMKVEASMQGSGHLATEAGKVDVEARYLFGGSAEGSRAQVSCSLQATPFKPKNNGQFHYGPVFVGGEKGPGSISVGDPEVTLDAEGRATVSCGGNGEGYVGTARLVADVAVFEAGSGRATRAVASVPVHPATFYIGLDTSVDKAGPDADVPVQGKVVDWEGKGSKAASELEVVVYRLEEEYGWWRWDERGEESYDLYLRRVEEQRTKIKPDSDGSFTYSFRPRARAAGYLVRVVAGNARTDLRLEGVKRRYWWSQGENQVDRTPRPAKPSTLAVTLPREISVGKRNEAVVDIPFDGRVLMTLETNELLTYEWVDVKSGPLTWPFTVNAFAPNVYVSAFLVKDPKLDSPTGYSPERGFGVASTRVSADAYTLGVKLEVPAEVRSNSELSVTVDLGAPGANASVTVAAVDEGILQLTRFETPDPIADVLPHKRLGITTYETVGWAMLMPAGPSSKTGGDGMDAGGRVQPVKPVALWSGKLTADAKGKAVVKLNVPQYRGALRVMAVAATNERVGSGEAKVLVRDPLVLQTTLPRFLSQGDTFQIPVFVTNMSGKAQDIEVSLSAQNLPWPGMPDDPNAPSPIAFLGERKAVVKVEDGKSKTVAFQARATAPVGAATFNVKVQAGNLVSYEELDVPFSPSGPKTRTTELVTLAAGKLDLAPHLSGWTPTTERSSLWVTGNPYGQAMGHLKHLIRYPYGCVEQTTSSTRPLLFVSNLVPAVMPEIAGGELEKMVMSGVDRILSMQTPSGGFGYWPGASEPLPWGTAYATHMLLDAKELQYPVPQDRIDDALDYLQSVAKKSSSASGFRTYEFSAPYAHYVLARGGRGDKAAINNLLGTMGTARTGEQKEAVYLLQAALFLAGDRRFEKQLRDPDVTPLAEDRKNNWYFYSDLRRRGMQLSIYQDLFGTDDAGGENLAKLVARGLEGNSSRYSTQELVWGVTGLGKRVAQNSTSGKVELRIDGKKVDPDQVGKPGKPKDPSWAVTRASERSVELDVKDTGNGRLFLVVNSEGIKENSIYQTGGKGLALTRDYLDAEGNEVDLAKVQLGDVVYAKIQVKNTGGERVQNIALVDRFGAGFEIENPRLNRSGVVDWLDQSEQWDAEYMNVRDDRLEMFGALESGQSREVVVGLRAVTAGEFTMPPVEADAMYDPSIWAREGSRKATIVGPWADVLL